MTVIYADAFTGNAVPAANFVVSEAGASGGSAALVSDKWRFTTSTTAGHSVRAILPSGNWNQANGRATMWWTTAATGPGNIVPQIMLRCSGDWSSEIDSPNTGYKMIFLNGAGVGLFKRIGGVTTQLGSFVSKTITTSTLYGFTLETTGSGGSAVQRCRMWTGAVEPGTWDITAADTAIAGPGQFQVALLSQDAASLQVNWDDLSLDNLVAAVSASGPRPRLMRL